jgi:hypothetical protein
LGAVALLLLVLVIVVHLPPVQRRAFDRASRTLFEATGWQLEAEKLSLRAWPARLRARGVRVGKDGVPVATVDQVSVRWSWLGVLRETPHLSRLEVQGVTADLRHLPAADGSEWFPGTPGRDPLQALEIGSFELRQGNAAAEAADILFESQGLRASASLIDGTARIEVAVERVILTRLERELVLGPVLLAARGGAAGVEIEQCSVSGEVVEVAASGVLSIDSGTRLELELAADLDTAAGWWDPNVASGLRPSGRLRLIGSATQTPGGDLEYRLEHTRSQLTLADYEIQDLTDQSLDGWPQISAEGAAWGRAAVWWNGETELTSVEAVLWGAPISPALTTILGVVPGELPGPITATGELSASFGFPVEVDTLSARSDLRLEWPRGVLEARGGGAARSWRAERLSLTLPGGGLRGSARFEGKTSVEADLELDSPDPGLMVAELSGWWPRAGALDIAGGPLAGTVSLSGDPQNPSIEGGIEWTGLEIAGVELESGRLDLQGSLAELLFEASTVGPAAARLELEGSADVRELSLAGAWWLQLPGGQFCLGGRGLEAPRHGGRDRDRGERVDGRPEPIRIRSRPRTAPDHRARSGWVGRPPGRLAFHSAGRA